MEGQDGKALGHADRQELLGQVLTAMDFFKVLMKSLSKIIPYLLDISRAVRLGHKGRMADDGFDVPISFPQGIGADKGLANSKQWPIHKGVLHRLGVRKDESVEETGC